MPDTPTNPYAWSELFLIAADPERYDWEDFHEGVRIRRLYTPPCEVGGVSAALLWYSPGARVPAHRHTGLEHILVLAGSQSDERGHYAAGTMVVNVPGSEHAVRSETGCVVLGIWELPVEFLVDV